MLPARPTVRVPQANHIMRMDGLRALSCLVIIETTAERKGTMTAQK